MVVELVVLNESRGSNITSWSMRCKNIKSCQFCVEAHEAHCRVSSCVWSGVPWLLWAKRAGFNCILLCHSCILHLCIPWSVICSFILGQKCRAGGKLIPVHSPTIAETVPYKPLNKLIKPQSKQNKTKNHNISLTLLIQDC